MDSNDHGRVREKLLRKLVRTAILSLAVQRAIPVDRLSGTVSSTRSRAEFHVGYKNGLPVTEAEREAAKA